MTVSLEGTKFQLKAVTVNDITSAYINWLNDAEIMQHTEQQFRTTTLEDASDYVALMAQSKTDLFYGLFYEGTHIGSIKLGKINPNHKTASESCVVGGKSFRGNGIVSKMIKNGWSCVLTIRTRKNCHRCIRNEPCLYKRAGKE